MQLEADIARLWMAIFRGEFPAEREIYCVQEKLLRPVALGSSLTFRQATVEPPNFDEEVEVH